MRFPQVVRALIETEAKCLARFAAFCEPFGVIGLSAEHYAECIERELRLGSAAYVLDVAERRMQRAG